MKLYAAIIATTLLTGCSTLIEGESQELQLRTDPPSAANCTLKNDRGNWSAASPSTATVLRSSSALDIACRGHNSSGSIKHSADAEAVTFGNILLGGLVGLFVDAATGAMFSYDDMITVPMQNAAMRAPTAIQAPTATVPAPAATRYQAVPPRQGRVLPLPTAR
jgi:hypothetical protein